MEQNNEINVSRWVDDRLATLTPPEGWSPDIRKGLALLDKRRSTGAVKKRTLIWIAAAAVALCICALTFPTIQVFAQRCVDACVAETSQAGQFLWNSLSSSKHRPGGVTGIGDRKMAPDFMLRDASGKSVRLSEFRGQVVLLNFWATWCSPCKIEIPWFVEFQQVYREAGVTVLGVSLDEDGWQSVKPYIQEKGLNYRVVVGSDETTRLYGGIESLPTTLLIDKAGRIAVKHVGLVEKKTYEESLKALIAEDTLKENEQ